MKHSFFYFIFMATIFIIASPIYAMEIEELKQRLLKEQIKTEELKQDNLKVSIIAKLIKISEKTSNKGKFDYLLDYVKIGLYEYSVVEINV